jgi:hypothetical protein
MKRKTFRGLMRDTDATTALEFGIIGNVLMLLLFAGLEIGMMMWTHTTLQAIANRTARCAALGCCYWTPSASCVAPATWAVDEASVLLGSSVSSTLTVSVTPSGTSSATCQSASGVIYASGGAYDVVNISLPPWVGILKYPIAATTQNVTACFPN